MSINRDTVEEFWSYQDITTAYKNADEGSLMKFSREFSRFLGVSENSIHLTSSGKSALEGLLNSRKDKRSVVMVAALNCNRVKDAIHAANCEIKTYDFQYEAGVFDWDLVFEAVTHEVGVLIVTHLYGVPVDLRRVRDFCTVHGIMLVEDCAQTLGGYVAGRQVGTWGDAAIFSFSYDKPISLGWGGMAVVNAPHMFVSANNISDYSSSLDPSREFDFLRSFIESMVARRSRIRANGKGISSIFYRVYNKLHRSASFDQDIVIGAIQAELGVYCLKHFPQIRLRRNANADLFSSLCPFPTWPITNEDIEPAWLKQKVFVSSPKNLESISRKLIKKGIRAGNFNWPNLMDEKSLHTCPISSQVASSWMDVPIHQKMERHEIEYMASIIREHI